MADLLPSIPDASAPDDAEPRVVGLEDEAADDVLGALSSTTARSLFAAINEKPAHPSALADEVDTSLQNVQYHLEKLQDAGMVEVVDTAYSEKGREMDVYAPADQPLVVFAGDQSDQSLLDQALGRLLGGVGAVAGASLAIRGFFTAAETAGSTGTEDGAAGQGAALAPEVDGGAGDADVTADAADGGGYEAAPPQGEAMEVHTNLETVEEGAYELQAEPDAAVGGDAIAGAEQPTGSVEPVAQDLAWVVEPLQATGLPPDLAAFTLGSVGVAVAVTGWYYWKRQTRV